MEEGMRGAFRLLIVVAVCATVLGITKEITNAKVEVAKLRDVEYVAGKCVGVVAK